MLLYGVGRFLIEFLRNDDRGAVGGLSTSQFISLFIVAAGILLMCNKKRALVEVAEQTEADVKPEAAEQTEAGTQPEATGQEETDVQPETIEPAETDGKTDTQ